MGISLVSSIILGSVLLTGCVGYSSHNLSDGESPAGGGYKVTPVIPNYYMIEVRTNWASWSRNVFTGVSQTALQER